MKKFRWQDYLALFLGLWVAASPWIFGIDEQFVVATWMAVAAGLAIVVLSAADLDAPAMWEEGAMLGLGAWTAVSPFVLGFTKHGEALASMLVAGVAVMALAGWELFVAIRADRLGQGHAHSH